MPDRRPDHSILGGHIAAAGAYYIVKDPEGSPRRVDAPLEKAPAGRLGADTLPRKTLEGVRSKESWALSEFFDFAFDRVYSLAARLLGDRTAAEDVTQEVFIKVYRFADSLDPDRDPLPWLTAIAYNECRNLWRSPEHRAKVATISIDGDPAVRDQLTGGTLDPEAKVLGGERDQLVQDAVMRLPVELRTVVILRDYAGMRHEDIAGLIGMSHAAVRKRYSRALGKLADELRTAWYE
jgi:RNA polymerase sigma-70 factor (ECF subfamily)